MRKLFRQFSFPGGIPSHVAPETPGSIHEGGELGYALSHAFGAAFDNPDLLVACVVGDGEAETGPLAASWHSNKFLNPRIDGAVLRSCISTATRSRTRLFSRGSLRTISSTSSGIRLGPHSCRVASTAKSRPRCTNASRCTRRRARRDRRDPAGCTRRRIRRRAAGRCSSSAPRKAGLVHGRSTASRSRERGAAHQVPLAGVRDNAEHRRSSRTGCGATGRRSCSTTTGTCARARGARSEWRRADECEPARERWGASCAISSCRTSATTASRSRRPGRHERGHARARWVPARRRREKHRQLPPLRPRRDRFEPARRRLRGDRTAWSRRRFRRTRASRPTVGSWNSCRSICARAGSRDTC